jgi:hypothetical protein
MATLPNANIILIPSFGQKKDSLHRKNMGIDTSPRAFMEKNDLRGDVVVAT